MCSRQQVSPLAQFPASFSLHKYLVDCSLVNRMGTLPLTDWLIGNHSILYMLSSGFFSFKSSKEGTIFLAHQLQMYFNVTEVGHKTCIITVNIN